MSTEREEAPGRVAEQPIRERGRGRGRLHVASLSKSYIVERSNRRHGLAANEAAQLLHRALPPKHPHCLHAAPGPGALFQAIAPVRVSLDCAPSRLCSRWCPPRRLVDSGCPSVWSAAATFPIQFPATTSSPIHHHHTPPTLVRCPRRHCRFDAGHARTRLLLRPSLRCLCRCPVAALRKTPDRRVPRTPEAPANPRPQPPPP